MSGSTSFGGPGGSGASPGGHRKGLPPPPLARNGVEIVGSTSGIFTPPLLVQTHEDKLWEAATDPRAAKSSRCLQRADFIRQLLASSCLFCDLVLIKRFAEFARYRRRLNRSLPMFWTRGPQMARTCALLPTADATSLQTVEKNCGGRFGGRCHGRRLRARRR